MDVSTALATAGISATVSALVSLAAVSSVTIRQERAKRRENARETLRETVQPLQHTLSRYIFGAGRAKAPRDLGGAMALDDLADAIRVTQAAEPLPRWRRGLVRRRLGRIYGKGVMTLIRDYPISPGAAPEGAVTMWLTAALLQIDLPDHPNRSLLHRTYSNLTSTDSGRTLARELRLLREAR
ncbi:hypothetical protein BJ980_000030 [Nocardioides daedukensis]|uniref:DUF4760 domain-containing protein n=1 Tax=Nocardioides daedukensis TaxID=634462 RepID=A0A7Y9RYJ8_9ACTN|nr:hypothetical protein [Nocardioides daedukensis]